MLLLAAPSFVYWFHWMQSNSKSLPSLRLSSTVGYVVREHDRPGRLRPEDVRRPLVDHRHHLEDVLSRLVGLRRRRVGRPQGARRLQQQAHPLLHLGLLRLMARAATRTTSSDASSRT